jgi:hypothetical protein
VFLRKPKELKVGMEEDEEEAELVSLVLNVAID